MTFFSLRALLLMLVVLTHTACKKNESEPTDPATTPRVTSGNLLDRWSLYKTRYRHYNPSNQLLSDRTFIYQEQNAGHQLFAIFDADTARYHKYLDGRLSTQEKFAYTRQNSIITMPKLQGTEKYTILELTDRQLVLEHRDLEPGGFYYITEAHYTR